MQIAALQERLHQDRDAADIVQILHDIAPARLQIGDVRRALRDLAEIVQVELDADLVRDRRDVQPAIGRAAGRRDDRHSVLDRLPRDDVAGPDVAPDEFHDGFTRRLGVGVARVVGCRCPGRSGQGQPDRLGDAGHRVRGEEAAARAR